MSAIRIFSRFTDLLDSLAQTATFLSRSNHTGTQPLSTISDAGSAAGKNVGVAPGNVIALDFVTGNLPAVNASQLTHLPPVGDIISTPPLTIQPGYHNYDQIGLSNARTLRLVSGLDSSFIDLSGIVGGVTGRMLTIVNVSAGTGRNFLIRHEASESQPANRFFNTTASDWPLPPNQSLDLIYDGTLQRWRVRTLDKDAINLQGAIITNAEVLFSGPDGMAVITADDGYGNALVGISISSKTTDPHVLGALWNNSGFMVISNG